MTLGPSSRAARRLTRTTPPAVARAGLTSTGGAVNTDIALLAQLVLLVPWLTTLELRLFVNDYQPTPTSRWWDFTEATFPGYSRQPLEVWSPPYLVPGPVAVTEACVKAWTNGSSGVPQTIYGYFVVTPVGMVAWAERDPHPLPLSVGGEQYTVQAVRTLRGQDTT